MKKCGWEVIVRMGGLFIPLASMLFNLNFNLPFSCNHSELPEAVYLDSVVLGTPLNLFPPDLKEWYPWSILPSGLSRVPSRAISVIKSIAINLTEALWVSHN